MRNECPRPGHDGHPQPLDECLGARCITGTPTLAGRRVATYADTHRICTRHGGPLDHGRCWECDSERDEAARDYEDGMISTRKHGLA